MSRKTVTAAMAALVLSLAHAAPAYALEEREVEEISIRTGEEFGICPELLQAVAWQESRYQEDAEAGGCSGLMQVSERWHRERMERLGASDLHDPEENMRVAADYLAELAEEYEDIGMALMVYNGDSGAGEYRETGKLSGYAEAVLKMSYELEQKHGK
ncbi:MAG: lytic transglycosylase domain-containing protein [Acetatifactor muris]|nr:lytic transglycosylase domain-containing protein [Acetatifactor muris]